MKTINGLRLLTFIYFSVILVGCGGGDTTTASPSSPAVNCSSVPVSALVVTNKVPANAESNVGVNANVSATFNGCVDMATINSSSFFVTAGSSIVAGSLSLDATTYTVTFNPTNDLAYDTPYMVVIRDTIKGVNGESFAGDGWGFFTRVTPDITAPVSAASITAGIYNTIQYIDLFCDDGVTGSGCVNTYYTIDGSTPTTNSNTFNGPIEISATTTLKYFSVDAENNIETVKTAEYIIDTIPPFVVSSIPVNASAGVNLTSAISMTFNEPILETTLTGSTFLVDNGVTGIISYDPASYTVTFQPNESLDCNTNYIATLTEAVSDLAGNTMSGGYASTFTSHADCDAPVTTASVAGGVYGATQQVTLSCNDGAGTGCTRIVYTTDGSAPSFYPQNGTIVTGGISSPINVGVGENSLIYFSEDAAGNREVIKRNNYSISNTGFTYVAAGRMYRGIGQAPNKFVELSSFGVAAAIHYDATNGRLYRAVGDRLYVSDDEGASWTYIELKDENGVIFTVSDMHAKGHMVYIASSSGFFVSDDAGATFQGRQLNTYSNTVTDVFVSGYKVYLATTAGLLVSQDKGHTFTRYMSTDGLGSDNVYAVAADGNTIYAGTSLGLSISNDGGISFINKTTIDGLAANYVNAIEVNNGVAYIATNSGLSITNDGGASFVNSPATTSAIFSLYHSGSTVYIGTYDSVGWSTDGGITFTINSPSWSTNTSRVRDIAVVGTKIFVGLTPSYYVSLDGGLTWEQQGLPSDGTSMGIEVTTDGKVYFAHGSSSGYGAVAVTSDMGQTFKIHTMGALTGSAALNSISSDGNTLYVSGSGILKTTDGLIFEHFDKTNNGLSNFSVDAVHGNGSTIYAVSGSTIDKSIDGGTTFSYHGTTAASLVNGIAIDGANVYVASTQKLGVSYDGWTTFVGRGIETGLPVDYLRDVAVDGVGNVYVSVSNNGIYKSVDSGNSFSPFYGSRSTVSTCGGVLYLGSGNWTTGGFLDISTDGGATFIQRTIDHGLIYTVEDACYVP